MRGECEASASVRRARVPRETRAAKVLEGVGKVRRGVRFPSIVLMRWCK